MKNYKDTVKNYKFLTEKVKEVCDYFYTFFYKEHKEFSDLYKAAQNWDGWFCWSGVSGDLCCIPKEDFPKHYTIELNEDSVRLLIYSFYAYENNKCTNTSYITIPLNYLTMSERQLRRVCVAQLEKAMNKLHKWDKPKYQQIY